MLSVSFDVFLNRFDNGEARNIQIQPSENALLAYIGRDKLPVAVNDSEDKYVLEVQRIYPMEDLRFSWRIWND